MEVNKDYFKFYVETERRNGTSARQIWQKLCAAWPEKTPSERTIERWFNDGENDDIKFGGNRQGAGRPRTSRTYDRIEEVRFLVEENLHVTCNEIEAIATIPHSTAYRIITEDLQLKGVYSKWVPHSLSRQHKERRVELAQGILNFLEKHDIKSRLIIVDEKWVYRRGIASRHCNRGWVSSDGDRPQLARRCQSDKKSLIMVAICFDGKSYNRVLEDGQSVNSEIYCDFLKSVFHSFSHRSVNRVPVSQLILQHDNARPHTARYTKNFLETRKVELLPQPAYSPDMNLCDRYVFSMLETFRQHIVFENDLDIKRHVTKSLRSFTNEQLNHEFDKLVRDLR